MQLVPGQAAAERKHTVRKAGMVLGRRLEAVGAHWARHQDILVLEGQWPVVQMLRHGCNRNPARSAKCPVQQVTDVAGLVAAEVVGREEAA